MSEPPSDDLFPVTGPDDHALAADIAGRAGALLLRLRAEAGTGVADPAAAKALGAEGDRLAHELIVAALGLARPDDAVLSEEGRHRGGEAPGAPGAGARRIWIVDPLDGTREFTEGRGDFAVHVALVDHGRPVAGAVALPGEDLVLATVPAPPFPAASSGAVRLLVSRTRPLALATAVAGRLGAETVALGSAGAKTMAVVRGRGDIYLHAGGQYEWDSAAPVAVALAAGLWASRLDGTALVYDRPDPWLPDLLVCRPELADEVLAAVDAEGVP